MLMGILLPLQKSTVDKYECRRHLNSFDCFNCNLITFLRLAVCIRRLSPFSFVLKFNATLSFLAFNMCVIVLLLLLLLQIRSCCVRVCVHTLHTTVAYKYLHKFNGPYQSRQSIHAQVQCKASYLFIVVVFVLLFCRMKIMCTESFSFQINNISEIERNW